MRNKVALVLTGGGARGAYQAGFLRGLAEISPDKPCPFSILYGVSVGSINASFIASFADDFRLATERLWSLWANLQPHGVFIPHQGAFYRNGLQWALRFIFPNRRKKNQSFTPLLDAKPLHDLLLSHLDMCAIERHIRNGTLHGVAFSATDYATGHSVTFFDGAPEIPEWQHSERGARRATLSVEHVVASAGLPLLFEPVRIGDAYYGDGSVRLLTPLSPAIHLGAEKIMIIPTHRHLELPIRSHTPNPQPPSFGAIMATLFRSAFSDALDFNLETTKAINQFAGPGSNEYRHIPTLECMPSTDLTALAAVSAQSFSRSFLRLLSILGATGNDSHLLLSHLAFENNYTTELLEIGYKDALASKVTLEEFLGGIS